VWFKNRELQAFKSAIGEVRAVGRNLNQIPRATYAGRVTGGAAVEDLRALLTVATSDVGELAI
jgi:hypothetical protein